MEKRGIIEGMQNDYARTDKRKGGGYSTLPTSLSTSIFELLDQGISVKDKYIQSPGGDVNFRSFFLSCPVSTQVDMGSFSVSTYRGKTFPKFSDFLPDKSGIKIPLGISGGGYRV